MRNPILLFTFWLLLFFLEIAFSWNYLGMPLKPHLSYFLLGYLFFTSPPLSSLFFASLSFVVSASFASSQVLVLLPIAILYVVIFSLRRKTALLEPLLSKTTLTFLLLVIHFNVVSLIRGNGFHLSSFISFEGVIYLSYWGGAMADRIGSILGTGASRTPLAKIVSNQAQLTPFKGSADSVEFFRVLGRVDNQIFCCKISKLKKYCVNLHRRCSMYFIKYTCASSV